jgi:hypothetical protein
VKEIVIVIGPQGSGKTQMGAALMRAFHATRLVDPWEGVKPLQPGDLALTNHLDPHTATGLRAIVIGVDVARKFADGTLRIAPTAIPDGAIDLGRGLRLERDPAGHWEVHSELGYERRLPVLAP